MKMGKQLLEDISRIEVVALEQRFELGKLWDDFGKVVHRLRRWALRLGLREARDGGNDTAQRDLKGGEVGFRTRRGYLPECGLYRRGCGRKLLRADVARNASHRVRNALGTFVVSRRKRFADLLSGVGLRLAETEEELPI